LVIPHASIVSIIESEYVMCRKVGHESASRNIDKLLDSGYLGVEDDVSIHRAASELKCSRALSLADCYTLAVAAAIFSTPVFARREPELVKEMERKPLPIQPAFLE
jgi:hypothetical protein